MGTIGQTVLIAPDSFGDTLTAMAAADAIARGWAQSRPQDSVILAPQSDGGPGFVDILATRFGQVCTTEVAGPLRQATSARWLQASGTAYLEAAAACGLHLLTPTPTTALAATTYGVGQQIDAALRAGATRIVIGLGGSATTDGGRGAVGALGGVRTAVERLQGVDLIAATDVSNPLLGDRGAATVFGPQKGADPGAVVELERRLTEWADELTAVTGVDVADLSGAGAAGGLGAALLALGGVRRSGADVVAEATGLAADIAAADLVITGEGKLDTQTLGGKVVASLASAGAEVVALAGQVALTEAQLSAAGIGAAYSLVDAAGSVERAMSDAANQLTLLARQVADGRE